MKSFKTFKIFESERISRSSKKITLELEDNLDDYSGADVVRIGGEVVGRP